ncbi:MAG: mannitol system component [Actinomycetota bacterium]|jgi:PTS system mannitol-specific IIA component|nr:mannitol system component [Actinomycetota bacterium]
MDDTDVTVVDLLAPASIRLDAVAPNWETAVRQVGAILVESGAVTDGYVDLMLERERSVSTFVGEGVAIPHGTLAGRDLVLRDSLCFVQYPAGVDWHGEDVRICIGIAAQGDGHVPILSQLAELLMESDRAEALRQAATPEAVLGLLTPEEEPVP